MRHVKGPDFPTAGIIVGREGIREAYRSGRGRIVMRARANIEELRGGRTAVVVTELPYGVRKGGDEGVIKKIADLVKEETLKEVADLKDLSDKSGMRIEIHLKRDVVPQVALNKLYKHTALQTTFGYNAVALVNGVPRTLGLRDLIFHYLEHQREVVTRRLKYELRQHEKRVHVLEGYLIALDNLDEVIELIRAADDVDAAREALIARFELSEIQAQAILDLRLRALTGLERKAVEDEYRDKQERIAELRRILGDESRIDAVIREELLEVKNGYGRTDDRRTEIVAAEGDLELEDLIAEEDMVIAITRSNYIKRLPVTAYREQRRGGTGVMGMELKDDDYIEHLFVASMRDDDELVGVRHSSGQDDVLMVSRKGQAIRFHETDARPMGRDTAGVKGMRLRKGDEVISINIAEAGTDLLVVTENGYGKRTRIEDYPVKGRGGLGVKTVQLTDAKGQLVGARVVRDGYQVMLISNGGTMIKIPVEDVKRLGRATQGVIVMRLRGDETVSALAPVVESEDDNDGTGDEAEVPLAEPESDG